MHRLRTVELYRDDRHKLIAIESVDFNHASFNHGGHLYGYLSPLAVIVCTPHGNQVIVVEADSSVDKLRQLHPGLDELIAGACRDEIKTVHTSKRL